MYMYNMQCVHVLYMCSLSIMHIRHTHKSHCGLSSRMASRNWLLFIKSTAIWIDSIPSATDTAPPSLLLPIREQLHRNIPTHIANSVTSIYLEELVGLAEWPEHRETVMNWRAHTHEVKLMPKIRLIHYIPHLHYPWAGLVPQLIVYCSPLCWPYLYSFTLRLPEYKTHRLHIINTSFMFKTFSFLSYLYQVSLFFTDTSRASFSLSLEELTYSQYTCYR